MAPFCSVLQCRLSVSLCEHKKKHDTGCPICCVHYPNILHSCLAAALGAPPRARTPGFAANMPPIICNDL